MVPAKLLQQLDPASWSPSSSARPGTSDPGCRAQASSRPGVTPQPGRAQLAGSEGVATADKLLVYLFLIHRFNCQEVSSDEIFLIVNHCLPPRPFYSIGEKISSTLSSILWTRWQAAPASYTQSAVLCTSCVHQDSRQCGGLIAWHFNPGLHWERQQSPHLQILPIFQVPFMPSSIRPSQIFPARNGLIFLWPLADFSVNYFYVAYTFNFLVIHVGEVPP